MWKLCYITILATLAVTSGEEYTVIVKSNGTLTLTCEANVPIHWCFPATYATPDNSETVNYTSPITINYEYSKTRKHKITIEVKNITYIYTGFYHCVRNDSQNLCNRQMESYMPKYVYVEDFNNLIVVKPFKRVWAPKFKQAVLPCLPTHPNVNMTLIKNGMMLRPGQQNSSLNVTYDPRLGFTIEPVEKNEIGYVCNATFENKTEKIIIDVDISAKGIELSPPVINATWKLEKNITVMEGDSLSLPCHSKQSEQLVFDITWKYPSFSKVQIHKEYCHEPGQMCKNYTLTINNITSDDAGIYTCMLMSPPMEPEMSSFELHVIKNNSDEHENNVINNINSNNIKKNSTNVIHFYKRSYSSVQNIDSNDFQQTSDDFSESHLKSTHSSGNFVIPIQQNIISIFVLQFIICSYLHV